MRAVIEGPLNWMGQKVGAGGAMSLPLYQVCNYLRNLNICKSMGPDKIP